MGQLKLLNKAWETKRVMSEEKWRVSGTCVVPASKPTYALWESQSEKKEVKRIFEGIMAENLTNLMKDNLQI